jgi:Flp pilus assembly protein protease CpaA
VNPVIDVVFAAVALVGTLVAVYTDLKRRIIPNWLTYPLIAFGISAHLALGTFNGDPWSACSGVIGAASTFVIAYAFWLTGGWAGGDVKLFTAYGALLPFYTPPATAAHYPFFITILFNSVIVAIPFLALYTLIRKALGKSVFYEVVRITELEEGMIPAELICRKNGKLVRMTSRLGIKPRGARVYADPSRAAGLTKQQIRELKRFVRDGKLENRLKLKRGMPFAPLLAAGLFVGVFYGDLYWLMLFALV